MKSTKNVEFTNALVACQLSGIKKVSFEPQISCLLSVTVEIGLKQ